MGVRVVEARWTMLGVLFTARIALALQFQTIGSAAPFLREQMHIGFAETGTLIGLYMLPGVLIAFPSGFLMRRFGDKALCATGLLMMSAGGLLCGLSHEFGLLLAGRLISGIGGVFLGVSVTKMTTDWFAGREIFAAMSIVLASWPLGIAVALVVYVPLALAEGWQWVMHVGAAASFLGFLLVAFLYRAPNAEQAAIRPSSQSFALPSMGEVKAVLIAGTIWGAVNLALILFFSFVPPLLMEHGYGLAASASVASIVLWLMIVSMPLGGQWLQRQARQYLGLGLLAAATGAMMAGLAFAPSMGIIFSVAIGCLFGPLPGAINTMPGRVLRPENRSVGLALFATMMYAFAAVGPSIAGLLRDHFGAGAPVLFGALLLAAAAPGTAWFVTVSRRAKAGMLAS